MGYKLYLEIVKRFTLAIGLTALLYSSEAFGASLPDEQLNVSVLVLPQRVILVDEHQTIIQITSNCPFAIEPKVYAEKDQIHELAYTPAIRSQYEELVKDIDFSEAKVAYRRDTRSQPPAEVSFVSYLRRYLSQFYKRWL